MRSSARRTTGSRRESSGSRALGGVRRPGTEGRSLPRPGGRALATLPGRCAPREPGPVEVHPAQTVPARGPRGGPSRAAPGLGGRAPHPRPRLEPARSRGSDAESGRHHPALGRTVQAVSTGARQRPARAPSSALLAARPSAECGPRARSSAAGGRRDEICWARRATSPLPTRGGAGSPSGRLVGDAGGAERSGAAATPTKVSSPTSTTGSTSSAWPRTAP